MIRIKIWTPVADAITVDEQEIPVHYGLVATCTVHNVFSMIPITKDMLEDIPLRGALEKRVIKMLSQHGCDCKP